MEISPETDTRTNISGIVLGFENRVQLLVLSLAFRLLRHLQQLDGDNLFARRRREAEFQFGLDGRTARNLVVVRSAHIHPVARTK
jgi:hypothetical protein